MGSIKTEIDFDKRLTTNIAEGRISYEDLSSSINDYYSGPVTQLNLWNFSGADLSKITSDEIMKIINLVKMVIDRSGARANGKTALVFSKDIGFGLGRMFGALSEIEDIQFG